jgi:hypothetical protein
LIFQRIGPRPGTISCTCMCSICRRCAERLETVPVRNSFQSTACGLLLSESAKKPNPPTCRHGCPCAKNCLLTRWRRSRRRIAPICSPVSRAARSLPAPTPVGCCARPRWCGVSTSSAPNSASGARSMSSTCRRSCCRSWNATCSIASSRRARVRRQPRPASGRPSRRQKRHRAAAVQAARSAST